MAAYKNFICLKCLEEKRGDGMYFVSQTTLGIPCQVPICEDCIGKYPSSIYKRPIYPHAKNMKK